MSRCRKVSLLEAHKLVGLFVVSWMKDGAGGHPRAAQVVGTRVEGCKGYLRFKVFTGPMSDGYVKEGRYQPEDEVVAYGTREAAERKVREMGG